MFGLNSELNSISEIVHYFKYLLGEPRMQLEKAILIVSADIDVGSSKLGVINKGERDRDINLHLSEYHIGEVEEISIPLFIETFDAFEIPMTLGVRGQLTEIGGKVMDVLRASKVKHDIGAHGYYHRMFTALTCVEAEDEIRRILAGMEKYGFVPRTFIFPRNRVAHLDLLEKYNFACYRGPGNTLRDRMCIEKCGRLYNVHPSIYVDGRSNPFLLKKILDISIRWRSPFHVWFHPWNFGEDKQKIAKTIQNLFVPFFRYAKGKQENELLAFETMLSAAKKAETIFKSSNN
jgi:peptidoglycan/xylan/chitin deacetylase (PgdA/CDA1 family)